MITHIEKEHGDIVYRMYCGASCFIFDDAQPVPDIDFYLDLDGYKATCQECKLKRYIHWSLCNQDKVKEYFEVL